MNTYKVSAVLLGLVAFGAHAPAASTGVEDRAYTVQVLTRIAEPVLGALSENQLQARMPVREWETLRVVQWHLLEAFGRTLAAVAPWIALGPDDTGEGRLRAKFSDLARRSLINATEPNSPDFCNFNPQGMQPLVDTAYVAEALLRAPEQLWRPLTPEQQANVMAAFKLTRGVVPHDNNWVLFASRAFLVNHFRNEH